jgi:hypothetical protein
VKNRRLVSSYGIKQIHEDIEETERVNCDWKEPGLYLYHWNSAHADWIRGDGEKLTGYIMDDKTRHCVEQILKGEINIEPPADIVLDVKELNDCNWQMQPPKVSALELELIQKMMDKDNAPRFVHTPKPATPTQTRLNL